MGTSSDAVYVTDSYDPQTGNLTEQDTQAGTAQTQVDDLNYTYNDVGDITSEADTPSGDPSATDVQCFQYDYLNRLVQAWAQGTTGCAAAPSASAEGGAAPYWESYTYNTIGNLSGITATSPTGAVTTTADAYPAAGAAQPHAITGQSVTTSSGTTTSSYAYDAAGNLTTVVGSSQDQALTWNDNGQLSQDAVTPAGSTTAQDTNYIYDADGNLLITADPGTTTLYLPDEELSLDTSTGTVTGTRYYTLGHTTVATLTGASAVSYVVGDQQGTDSLAIDADTLALTRRYYDPYGNPRGTTPSSFPTGEKGFVGGASDPSTGLTDLGAREYQPQTGSFISADPLLNPYDPQDLNAYTYAADNPSTESDPTGAAPASTTCKGGGVSSVLNCTTIQAVSVTNLNYWAPVFITCQYEFAAGTTTACSEGISISVGIGVSAGAVFDDWAQIGWNATITFQFDEQENFNCPATGPGWCGFAILYEAYQIRVKKTTYNEVCVRKCVEANVHTTYITEIAYKPFQLGGNLFWPCPKDRPRCEPPANTEGFCSFPGVSCFGSSALSTAVERLVPEKDQSISP
jgi:RHS repeat-associated protein